MSKEENSGIHIQVKKKEKKYDLEERTTVFAEWVIEWLKQLPETSISKRIISQLAASSTSLGANYCEADCAESNKDFIHKMSIANKEAKESKYFVRILSKLFSNHAPEGRLLWKEAHELNLIFTTIVKNAKATEEKKNIDKSSKDEK